MASKALNLIKLRLWEDVGENQPSIKIEASSLKKCE